MKYLSIFLFLFLISCSCDKDCCKKSTARAGYGSVYSDNIIITRDVVYARDDTTQQVIDIYLQGNFVGEPNWINIDKEPKPTLIYIHGGGWLGGDKANNPYIFSEYLQRGWNVFSPNYRMGDGTAPDAAEDVICALQWIVDRKEEYNVDLTKIYTIGHSAGGHLSLIAGLAPTSGRSFTCDVSDISIKGIINFFGITEIKKNGVYPSFSQKWLN